LIWDPTPSRIYSPKLGYLKYNSDLGLREPVWWWRKLWKIKSPAKTRLFMWNVLSIKFRLGITFRREISLALVGALFANLKERILYTSF
jgi:hypothetical protein